MIKNIFRNLQLLLKMSSSWGCDLWDRYNPVVGHVTKGAHDLVDVYAKFVKEKAELEKE